MLKGWMLAVLTLLSSVVGIAQSADELVARAQALLPSRYLPENLKLAVDLLEQALACDPDLLTSLPGIDGAGAAAIRERAAELAVRKIEEEAARLKRHTLSCPSSAQTKQRPLIPSLFAQFCIIDIFPLTMVDRGPPFDFGRDGACL